MAATGRIAGAAPPWRAGWVAAIASFLLLQSAAIRAQPSSAQQQARQRQMRLLCATMFGDFSEPFEALMFRRCLAHPEQMLRPGRPINMRPLVTPNPAQLLRPGTPSSQAETASHTRPTDTHEPPKSSQQLLPLGPGVNKGNVDSSIGARRYYFWVGPGQVRVRMAFKKMGLFGTPLRQALTFDFFDEAGHLLSHNAVASEGSLETIETGGNIATPGKLILRIKPQDGLLRMGGYYEVTVTGAAAFDRSSPEGEDVVPQDTSLLPQDGVRLTTPGK